MPAASSAMLSDPAWFPDRIDWNHRLLRMARTMRQVVTQSAFLDGRTSISPGNETVTIPLDMIIPLAAERTSARWMLHESFCGSTLAARLLSIEGRAVTLREPQILVDLCNWGLNLRDAAERARFRTVADAVVAKLSQRWHPDEAVIIKPSNWVNPILYELVRPDRGDTCLVMRVRTEAFIIAVLRGGRERIEYVLRLYQQIVAHWPVLGEAVDREIGRSGNQMAVIAQLIAAMHWAQSCLLHAALGPAHMSTALLFPDWLSDAAVIAAAAARLSLTVSDEELRGSIRRNVGWHAKDPSRAREAGEEAVQNGRIAALNAEPIAAAEALVQRLHQREGEIVAKLAQQVRSPLRNAQAAAG